MSVTRIGSDEFEIHRDFIDVTSNHRPDTRWVFVDAHGHEHRWYVEGGGPNGDHISASTYSPAHTYITPTLIWVKDGEEWWDGDDEPHDIGHLECRQCGEHVAPRYTQDDTRQFIPGIASCRINGESVTLDEFMRRYNDAINRQQ